MTDLRALAEKIGPEEWKLNTGVGVGDAARKDADRLGWFVFRPHWGAVAATPKSSPQFSRHSTLMKYIAAADPKAVLGLFEEIERLRAVLGWYADPGHWYAPEGPEASVIWQGGKGEKARVARGSI